MTYRYEAQSPEAVVQLIAASYLRHGFSWYVTGSIPNGKNPGKIDRKLIAKYGIDVSEWNRRSRKQRGVANAHDLRHQQWFILLVSDGHHALKQPSTKGGEGEIMKAVIDKILLSNDVLHMEGNKRRCGFRNSTVFAPPLSSLTHNRSCGCVHDYREGFARTRRALACKIEITSTASTN